MRLLAATIVMLALSVSAAQAQSSKPCPHRHRKFMLIGAGIVAGIGAAGYLTEGQACIGCGLLGAPFGAFWGWLVAEGTTADCENVAKPTEPARPEATSRVTSLRLHPRIDVREKSLSLAMRF